MIKARITTTAGQPDVLVLGLSDRNLELLRQGRPMLIRAAELGVDHDVGIVWGHTEADILAEINEARFERSRRQPARPPDHDPGGTRPPDNPNPNPED